MKLMMSLFASALSLGAFSGFASANDQPEELSNLQGVIIRVPLTEQGEELANEAEMRAYYGQAISDPEEITGAWSEALVVSEGDEEALTDEALTDEQRRRGGYGRGRYGYGRGGYGYRRGYGYGRYRFPGFYNPFFYYNFRPRFYGPYGYGYFGNPYYYGYNPYYRYYYYPYHGYYSY